MKIPVRFVTVSDSRRSVARIVHALMPVLIVALIAAIAAPARCGPPVANSIVLPHREETLLPYVARVYSDPAAKDDSDAYYEILKDGKPVYLQKAKQKGEKFYIGTMSKDDPEAAQVKMGMDITGDRQPDLVISEWTGGTNCCLVLHIFEIGPTFRILGTIDTKFAGAGPYFVRLDKNLQTTGMAIQISDWSFANWHADFADSPAPKVVLRFSDDAYRVSPDLMRDSAPTAKDLEARAALVRNYAPSAKGSAWPDAEVSPQLWAMMLDLIYSGNAGDAWKFLDKAWPPKIGGKEAFARDFRAQLAKSPYWPGVEAMNASKHPSDKNDQSAGPSPTATE